MNTVKKNDKNEIKVKKKMMENGISRGEKVDGNRHRGEMMMKIGIGIKMMIENDIGAKMMMENGIEAKKMMEIGIGA